MTNAVALLEAHPDAGVVAAAEMQAIERQHTNPELQQQRFAELHRRVWNSDALIAKFAEEGKVHAESHERRFQQNYRYEIAGLIAIAGKDERVLQVPDREEPTAQQARQAALVGVDALKPIADFVRPDGRRQRTYLIKTGHSTTFS